MNEIRHDLISGHAVIIAPQRAARPIELTEGPKGPGKTSCDFCGGREAATPGESFAIRPDHSQHDQPGWRVRVIPNKYPAIVPHGADLAVGNQIAALSGPGQLHAMSPGAGVHEVIVETPRHVSLSADLSVEEWRDVLFAYRERIRQLQRMPGLRHALIFKNVGLAAGASMEHLHSQLVATRTPSNVVRTELSNSQHYFETHGKCPFCVMMTEAAERHVATTNHFSAFCPYASRTPFETWILPRPHEPHFWQIPVENLGELASVVRSVLVALERVLAVPTYNLVLHTSPFDSGHAGHYHWHIEIIPRVTRIAGFELGSGYFINPVPPESAAQTLRSELAK